MQKRKARNIAIATLALAAAIALYLLVARDPFQWDLTLSANNSLDRNSVEVLGQLHDEIRLTVFSNGKNAKGDDVRPLIRGFIALYQRYKPDITLKFVDPVLQPEQARLAGIQANGEMLVEYAGRREHLTMLSEPSLTGALLRLGHSGDKSLLYLDGHGERKLDGIANRDLGEFGKRLRQYGYRIGGLNLTIAQDVPQNVSVLVITQPQVDLLPGEIDKLLRYVDSGGNLLWLVDAEPLHGLAPLAEKLGLELTPGIVIDPAAEAMRAPATWAMGANYPEHAVTHHFNLITVFPFARMLGWNHDETWQRSPLAQAAPRGWVSPHAPPDTMRLDKPHDARGPITVALALQRTIGKLEQRIVVVGSGSFLANAYSLNGGNLNLGINMVNWLANEDKLIAIQPREMKDGLIILSKNELSLISIGFAVVLPFLFILAGGVAWFRRRR